MCARILFMSEQLRGYSYICRMDDLFIFAKYFLATKSDITQMLIIYSVCWMHNCGLPEFVIQKEVKREEKLNVFVE